MLLLSTSFFNDPLPRSHRQGGFEKNMFPSTSYSFLFQIKAAAHMETHTCYIHIRSKVYILHLYISTKSLIPTLIGRSVQETPVTGVRIRTTVTRVHKGPLACGQIALGCANASADNNNNSSVFWFLEFLLVGWLGKVPKIFPSNSGEWWWLGEKMARQIMGI